MGLREELDKLYLAYNDRKFVHPDPLEFLYRYDDIKDREVAGLIASSLAYGRVIQILKSVSLILDEMAPSPYFFIIESSRNAIYDRFKNFKHRFTTGDELCRLLAGIKDVLSKYGTLNNCFLEGFTTYNNEVAGNPDKEYCKNPGGFTLSSKKIIKDKSGRGTTIPAILSFAEKLNVFSKEKCNSLIPSCSGNSAFKRLNLYLRWMVRRDNVDPGGWVNIPASRLIIPLDTHMYRISVKLGLTRRRQADIKTALEITEALKNIDIDDPVKYDFALTRICMNKLEEILLKKIF